MLLTEYDEAEAMELFRLEGERIGRKKGEEIGEKRGETRGIAKGEARGRILGTVETLRDEGKDDQTILERLITRFKLSREEAESYVYAEKAPAVTEQA